MIRPAAGKSQSMSMRDLRALVDLRLVSRGIVRIVGDRRVVRSLTHSGRGTKRKWGSNPLMAPSV